MAAAGLGCIIKSKACVEGGPQGQHGLVQLESGGVQVVHASCCLVSDPQKGEGSWHHTCRQKKDILDCNEYRIKFTT
jgi:hypothetical protein